MTLDFYTFINKDVYDKAVYAGSLLRKIEYVNSKKVKTDKSTVENIISIFQSREDPHEAALLTMLYISRQMGRNEIPQEAGKNLLSTLKEIYNSFKSEGDKLKEAFNKYLILVKWVFESEVKPGLKNFDEFIEYSISKVRR